MIFALLPAACGGQEGTTGGGSEELAKKCSFACTPPSSEPCVGSSMQQECEQKCIEATKGTDADCVQCIVDSVHWGWIKCTCEGDLCTRSQPGSSGGSTELKCDQPTDNTCKGFNMDQPYDDRCKKLCAP